MDVVPAERPARLGDQVYGQLLEQISSGRLGEGSRLPTEKELCSIFGVSRPVVREALSRLQTDGVIVSRQGSGTYVQRKPPERLTQLVKPGDVAGMVRSFEVRIVLEGLSAKLAAQRRNEDDLKRVHLALQAMRDETAEKTGLSREKDFDFHRSIALASQNELLVSVLDALREAVQGVMAVALTMTREASQERRNRVLDEHERIYRSLQAGDAEGAEIAMRYHLDQARSRLLDRQLDR